MNVVLLQGPVNITSSRPIQDEEANLNHQRSKVEPLDISNVESSKKPKLPSSCNVQPAELGENADSTLKKTDTSVMPVLENCSEKHRAVHGSTIFWGFPIGMIVLAGISYGLKNWVYIQITIAVLFVVSLILTWFLPESPRWLITKGRLEEATKVIEHAAKRNHIDISGKREEIQKKIKDMHLKISKYKKEDIEHVFLLVSRNKIKKFLNRVWAVNAFVYYGLSFNTNNLGGNPFINFFIAAAVEIPAYLLAALLVRYIGRKISLMMFMVIGGIACASPIVIPEEMTELSVAFPMIGKLCISGSFAIIYVYAAELFPTVARNIGVSSCSMVARIGSIGAPYVKELGIHTHRSTPFAVYAVLSISSGLLILLLPETKDASIPDSMEEAEQMTRCQRVKYLS
ncbi:Organic cation transporter protein [Nymphon striatum]|nr:Organic cation transporter protein [Nymphon striatum]KAG1682038.1 Organic cation transporter protein [Nymphon striatum]